MFPFLLFYLQRVERSNVNTLIGTRGVTSAGAGGAGWSVTFEETDLCAPLGASVEIGCSYDYTAGETVQQTAWHKGRLQRGLWTRVALADLPSFQNRSEYLGDRRHDCGLAIHDLRVNDSGHYYFWFDTETFGRRSQGSVYLTVTGKMTKPRPFLAFLMGTYFRSRWREK